MYDLLMYETQSTRAQDRPRGPRHRCNTHETRRQNAQHRLELKRESSCEEAEEKEHIDAELLAAHGFLRKKFRPFKKNQIPTLSSAVIAADIRAACVVCSSISASG